MSRTTRFPWIQFQCAVMTFAIVILLVGMDACTSSKELTRRKASGLIEKSPDFKAAAYEVIFLGTDFRTADFFGGGNWKVVDSLIALGYLQKQGNQISLTSKGEAGCKDAPRDPQRPNSRSFPVANRELVEVTGVADVEMMGPGMKEVQFQWRWSMTPLGTELSKANPGVGSKYSPDKTRKGEALLRLYDDGWRVEKIRFG